VRPSLGALLWTKTTPAAAAMGRENRFFRFSCFNCVLKFYEIQYLYGKFSGLLLEESFGVENPLGGGTVVQEDKQQR
jgi:hypothetical protein